MTLREELIKICVDKLAIGALLLAAGYWLNKSIEKLRSIQALKAEISKQKFSARLQRLERQLSEFYWPVYLRLQKDNTVWRRILEKDRRDDDPLGKIGAKIEVDFILPNHRAIVQLIEAKLHLARPDKPLQDALLAYVDHVAVYSAAVEAGITELHNAQRELLPQWPEALFPQIEQHTLRLQSEYDALLGTVELER